MKGKEKCKLLKEVRKEFAEANGIPYEPRECHYEGDCLGTCPACEKETEDLLALVKQKEENGEDIKTVDLEKKCQQLEAERIEEFLESGSDLRGDIDFSRYQEFQNEQIERIKDEIRAALENVPEEISSNDIFDSEDRPEVSEPHTTMGILIDPKDEHKKDDKYDERIEKKRIRKEKLKDFFKPWFLKTSGIIDEEEK